MTADENDGGHTPPDRPPREPVEPRPRPDPRTPNPKPIDDPHPPKPGKTMRSTTLEREVDRLLDLGR
jgi:hypothetical protein